MLMVFIYDRPYNLASNITMVEGNAMHLAERKCVPCRGHKKSTISRKEKQLLLTQLKNWRIEKGKFLKKEIALKNFAQALRLANQIGAIAEKEGHHPDLTVVWGELGIKLWTHKLGGLSENDFILAAKIDKLIKKKQITKQ